MSGTEIAFYGLIFWQLIMLFSLATYRCTQALKGKMPAGGFSPFGNGGKDLETRITRAHANCYENIPLFAVVLAASYFAGKSQLTDGYAQVLLGARVAQSLIHIMSTSQNAITVRFIAYLVQIICLVMMLFTLIF